MGARGWGLITAIAVLVVVLFPQHADAAAAHHAFTESPAGFIGCFEVVAGSPGICLEAYEATDGLHLSFSHGLTLEEAVDAQGSITPFSSASGDGIRITATLPIKGAVDVVSLGGEPLAGVGCAFCWRPNYEIFSQELKDPPETGLKPVIRFGTEASGTIGADQVTSRGRWHHEFNSHWIDGLVAGFYLGPSATIYVG